MKTIIFLIAAMSAISFAQKKSVTKEVESKQFYIQMHEQMAKAHQQFAECLKSGKPEEECRQSFKGMCENFGGADKCGPWMHRKMRNLEN